MRWIALFSRTGSEIVEVSKKIGKTPDLILTNKINFNNINKQIYEIAPICLLPNIPKERDYKKYINIGDIITLHGFLRIIPKEICSEYNIYNLHPGLITKYPILKGIDPQEKAYKLNLPSTGVVIHKVTEEIDSGEILMSKEINIKKCTLTEIYENLHIEAIKLWSDFLVKILYNIL